MKLGELVFTIELNTEVFEKGLEQVIELCEQFNFDEAETLLQSLPVYLVTENKAKLDRPDFDNEFVTNLMRKIEIESL